MTWARAVGGGATRAAARWLFPEGHRDARLAPLLLVLTFVSGLVDAASFLGLGRVFVANMTGNVVFLGFALSGVAQLSALASVVALAGFLAGAVAGGAWRRDVAAGELFAPLVAVQALLAACALAAATAGWGRYAVLVPLACGMGLQNAVVHRLGVPDLTTTVMTRTLTGLAADRAGRATVRRGVSVVALAAGALCGGLLHARGGVEAVVAVVLGLWFLVALTGLRWRRGPEPSAV
ncbi:YoaK family protein [Streptomyces sp. NPDC059083]|uniref:YoaK family protein n=1 Tax=Streptomyces sp. NPDC059083 TaxID=3346721 RepID=UPI0036A3C2F3